MKLSVVFLSILCLTCLTGVLGQYRWCCKSSSEWNKCNLLSARVDSQGNPKFDFSCVQAISTDACLDKIWAGEADVIDIDGGDIYRYKDKITVVAGENTANGDASYYAVAVVKQNEEHSLINLEGAKSCHTGVGKTSGWNMPIGWLYTQDLNTNPFSQSCAPGAELEIYRNIVPGNDTSKWCDLCVGDEHGNHRCDRNHDEKYYGYDGAFKCMSEHEGRIAFVKHSTPFNKEGSYKLLCPNGESAPISEWKNCTLGKVPSHAVVMRAGVTKEAADEVFSKLEYARVNNEDFLTLGGKNKLWGTSINSFSRREDVTPKQYLGIEYYCNIQALITKTSDCDFEQQA